MNTAPIRGAFADKIPPTLPSEHDMNRAFVRGVLEHLEAVDSPNAFQRGQIAAFEQVQQLLEART